MRGGGGRKGEEVDGGGSSLSGHPFPTLDTETGSGDKIMTSG